MFREKYPLAWMFHRNTSRWPYNVLAPPSTPCEEPPFKEICRAPVIPLPEPDLPTATLADTVTSRLSCRRFTPTPLGPVTLATLLKVAYGVLETILLGNQEYLERPVPSGGGLYPLELYVFAQRVDDIDPGIYHYAVLPHALEQVRSLALPRQIIGDLFLGQPYVGDAASVIALTAVMERSLWKYGDRGYRYVLFEAGHVAQNLNLMATAMGLGCLDIGGFFDSDVAGLLDLDTENEVPLYGVAVGSPCPEARSLRRLPPD